MLWIDYNSFGMKMCRRSKQNIPSQPIEHTLVLIKNTLVELAIWLLLSKPRFGCNQHVNTHTATECPKKRILDFPIREQKADQNHFILGGIDHGDDFLSEQTISPRNQHTATGFNAHLFFCEFTDPG